MLQRLKLLIKHICLVQLFDGFMTLVCRHVRPLCHGGHWLLALCRPLQEYIQVLFI
jgi:hypothetical protein